MSILTDTADRSGDLSVVAGAELSFPVSSGSSFAAGDSLLLYSDGITEALDARGNEFGEESLRELWRTEGARDPAHVKDACQRYRTEHFAGTVTDVELNQIAAPCG